MYLRRPVIQIRPEIVLPEADLRPGPVDQILALHHKKAGLRRINFRKPPPVRKLHIGIVFFTHRIGQDERIADMDIADMIRIPFLF